MCFHPFSRDEQRDPMGLMVRLHSSSYVRSRTDRQQAPFSQDHQKTITKEHRCCLLFNGFQRYTYRVLQTIQMKLILLCIWAEQAVLGSAKTALKFKYET